MVDLATITGIVNAEISASANIADTKLATIATAGTVQGTALTGLANIPSAAGVIPAANVARSFVTGDWILSTVTTARTGWTNVSATYSNKFMRINATPLTTGGSDTYSLSIAEANLPSHSHAAGTLTGGAHTHSLSSFYAAGDPVPVGVGSALSPISQVYRNEVSPSWTGGDANYNRADSGGGGAISGSTGAIGSGTAKSIDTVPAYVQVVIFQKD